MKKKIIFLAAIFICNIISAGAQSLKVGDIAPPLQIIKWLKGKQITSFKKGKVYLVEFGYVNCPPCRGAIPHLSDLSRKYRNNGNVEVISIFTAESNPKNPRDLSYIKRIDDLVSFMGDKMDYTVAVDVPSQKTRQLWGNLPSFPKFFIVDQEGRIALNSGGFVTIDFALESIVNTGKFNANTFLKWKQESGLDSSNYRWIKFNELQNTLKNKGDYTSILRGIDSIMPYISEEEKEILTIRKFETYLNLRDSVTADKYLEEIVSNTRTNWENLHGKFQSYVPPSVIKPVFNFERYLIIANRAIEQVGTPFLQASHMIIQANILYAYKRNAPEANAILNKALLLAKRTHISKDIEIVKNAIARLNQDEKTRKQADSDWIQILKFNSLPSEEEDEELRKNDDNIVYQQTYARYKNKVTALAEEFFNKYPSDDRRGEALDIFLHANYALVPWLGSIKPDLAIRLNDNLKQLTTDKLKSHLNQNLSHTVPYSRTLPRDLKGEVEWVKKGDEMVEEILVNASKEEQEFWTWEVFCRDWRSASFYWLLLPYRDERPDDEIVELESSFWKGVAIQYWQRFWEHFNMHINEYCDFPVIADRASDFLSGTAGTAPELVISYWEEIINKYGNPSHPLAKKAGIIELCKRATEQLYVLKIKQKDVPVDMKFTAIDGREIDLKNYRGKVVLIDFWATWCKPCVGEMPALKTVYDKYHEKGFEMIGISLDQENKREEVKQLLAKNSLIGPQRFEGKGFAGDRYKQLYGIFGLPTAWLIDKNGLLVSTNARGEELERLLVKYLGSSK